MKIYQKIILIVLLLIILGITFFIVDYTHIKNDTKPIFVIQSESIKDGGTTLYVGIGYKVIRYNVTESESDETKYDYEMRPWFVSFD